MISFCQVGFDNESFLAYLIESLTDLGLIFVVLIVPITNLDFNSPESFRVAFIDTWNFLLWKYLQGNLHSTSTNAIILPVYEKKNYFLVEETIH